MNDTMTPYSIALLEEMREAIKLGKDVEFWSNCIDMLLKAFYMTE